VSPRTLAFCDPGLDRASIAIFRFTTGPRQLWDLAPMQEKLRVFVHVRAIKTTNRLSLPERLLEIARGVHVILSSEKADRFYMETPRFAGTYRERGERSGQGSEAVAVNARAMMLSHHASGAILAAAMTVLAGPGAVTMVPAFRGGKGNSKADRLERVRLLLQSIGRAALGRSRAGHGSE
jgi:hypothetical protein